MSAWRVIVRRMIWSRPNGSVKRRAARRPPGVGTPAGRAAVAVALGYSPGSIANSPCGGRRRGAIVSGPRRRDARGRPEDPGPSLGNRVTAPQTGHRRSRPRLPPASLATATHQPSTAHQGPHRTYGREAGLARRPRRAPGHPLARELRDLAARHRARRGRRPALPDRRPERLRQGLARDPLPLADLPDARPGSSATASRWSSSSAPDRRRRRRPRRRTGPAPPRRRRRSAAGATRSALEPTRVGGEGGTTNINPATRSRTSSSARPTASPTRPACRSPSAPATPTTRSSCTAAWPRQDPPDARDRQPGDRQVPAQAGRLRDAARSSPTSSSRRSSRARSTSSGPATGGSTSSSSTTSSSSPTRSGPRKSSSTRSTRSTRTASRSS